MKTPADMNSSAAIYFDDHGDGVVTFYLEIEPATVPTPAFATAMAAFVAIPRLVEGIGIKPIACMDPELRKVIRP